MQEVSSNLFIPPHPLNTAVLFLVFNRPDTTKQVFEAIRKAKPPRLYVAADGPRADKTGEAEKVEQVRRIATQVDWDCEVKTLFREKNLGCRVAVSSAIDWFFENEEEGIILEDDCLPSLSFFWFCEELLKRFRNDPRIMIISGDNRYDHIKKQETSYIFSIYPLIWGWATWRKIWRSYDPFIKSWPYYKQKGILSDCFFSDTASVKFWEKTFDSVYNNQIDTWDYQLSFQLFINSGLCIVPSKNQISNKGFGRDSTHTHASSSATANYPAKDLLFPLTHPQSVTVDHYLRKMLRQDHFTNHSLFERLLRKLKKEYLQIKQSF